MQNSNKKGFTLLELLIVIGIIAILSVVVILVLNPAETLRKSRDTQRMSDLATLKTALGLYMTTVSPVYLSGASDNTQCQGTLGTWTTTEDGIFYSYPSDSPGADITDVTIDGATFSATYGAFQALNADLSDTDGTGWLPVDLTDIIGGSPISNMPLDPTNTITTPSTVASTDLVYRYACANVGNILNFEINATLESAEFTTSPNDRRIKDGGNNTSMYEVGTINTIIGTGTDF